MKLTEAEDILKAIQKMPLAEKQKQILEIQKKSFKYQNKQIKEIIKDKWVFIENNADNDIVDIDYVLLEWAEKEQLRIEKEEAKSGDTVIGKYFKKYGTLSQKEKPKDCARHNQILYFDGKACPGETWNTELSMHILRVSDFNDSNFQSKYVSFDARTKIEHLMDAKMKNGEPTLRHCHDWYTSPHKNSEQHYKHENWLEDIEKAKKIFLDTVKKMTKEFETFNYNSKKELYWVPKSTVFWFEHKADHNGDSTAFYSSKIYNKNNYKGSGFRSNTQRVPLKFDKTVSREEILELANKYCEDKLEQHGFRKEFKY